MVTYKSLQILIASGRQQFKTWPCKYCSYSRSLIRLASSRCNRPYRLSTVFKSVFRKRGIFPSIHVTEHGEYISYQRDMAPMAVSSPEIFCSHRRVQWHVTPLRNWFKNRISKLQTSAFTEINDNPANTICTSKNKSIAMFVRQEWHVQSLQRFEILAGLLTCEIKFRVS